LEFGKEEVHPAEEEQNSLVFLLCTQDPVTGCVCLASSVSHFIHQYCKLCTLPCSDIKPQQL